MQVSKYDNYQSYHQHIHDTVAGHVHVHAYCGNILNIVANILSYSKCYLGNKCTKYTHTFAWIITPDFLYLQICIYGPLIFHTM